MKKVKRNIILFLTILVIAFLIKLNSYTVVSESMHPTLLTGDNVFVLKNSGAHLNKVVIFRIDSNENIYYVKRCVAKSGDKLEIKNGILNVNGTTEDLPTLCRNYLIKYKNYKDYIKFLKVNQIRHANFFPNGFSTMSLKLNSSEVELLRKSDKIISIEDILDNKSVNDYKMYAFSTSEEEFNNKFLEEEFFSSIPETMNEKDIEYFMLGDNRFSSIDSRRFGTIPERNIIGKPKFILYSCNNGKFRWDRFLKRID